MLVQEVPHAKRYEFLLLPTLFCVSIVWWLELVGRDVTTLQKILHDQLQQAKYQRQDQTLGSTTLVAAPTSSNSFSDSTPMSSSISLDNVVCKDVRPVNLPIESARAATRSPKFTKSAIVEPQVRLGWSRPQQNIPRTSTTCGLSIVP